VKMFDRVLYATENETSDVCYDDRLPPLPDAEIAETTSRAGSSLDESCVAVVFKPTRAYSLLPADPSVVYTRVLYSSI